MLEAIRVNLAPESCWQYAYREGYSVIDLALTISLLAQKCMQGGLGFVLAPADIPKAYDFLRHRSLLTSLGKRGVPDGVAAWFLRHIRSVSFRISLCGTELSTETLTRGVPQGSRWGPKFFKAVLSDCLDPVWESCVQDCLGIAMRDIAHCGAHLRQWCAECCALYIPFLVWSDNVFILGHTVGQCREIWGRCARALSTFGWALPADRVKFIANNTGERHIGMIWPGAEALGADQPMKVTGIWVNSRGQTDNDVRTKTFCSTSSSAAVDHI